MAHDLQHILEVIADDEETLQGLYDGLDDIKIAQREEIRRIIERWLVDDLSDDNGFLLPNALDLDDLDEFERELLSFYDPEFMNEIFEEVMLRVQRRLETIDQMMIDLELEESLLGADVFELETVNEEIDRIAESFVIARDGNEGNVGAVDRIRDSMQRYRFDRSKSEFTLRSELMDTLQKDTQVGANYTNSIAISSMATIDRKLRRIQAEEAGIEYGLYLGPYDDLIRDFCDTWIGQVETWEFWEGLSNDMPEGLFDAPVSIVAGGINCRHRIIGWKLEWSDGERDLRERIVQGESVAPPIDANAFQPDSRIEEELLGEELNPQFKNEMGNFFSNDDAPKVSIRADRGTYYDLTEDKITFRRDVDRRAVYHEYGHAFHFRTKAISLDSDFRLTTQEFTRRRLAQEFYEGATIKIKGDPSWNPSELHALFKEREASIRRDFLRARALEETNEVSRLQDEWSQLGNTADVLGALTNGEYGWGHSKKYWQQSIRLDEMEFMAHAFEFRYDGNDFVDMIPNLRDVYENDFDAFMREMIKLSGD